MDLTNIDLLKLQSQYMQKDFTTISFCKILTNYYQIIADKIKLCVLYERIDSLDSWSLDELAFQFDVDFYELDMNIDKKRELIKSAIKFHKKKGTPAVVEEVATIVFGRSKLREWFEYNGNPFYFMMDIDITEQGASKENIEKLEFLINKYKNTRSWLEKINIFLANKGSLYYASCLTAGEEITVYPWTPKNIESKGIINLSIANIGDLENITIYPRKEE